MKKAYLRAAVALLIGLFIYLFYRTENTVVNELVIRLVSENYFLTVREIVRQTIPLSDFAVYSLPEGLWVFSVTITSATYYLGIGRFKLDGTLMPPIVSIGLEIIQLFRLSHGQFDWMDIMVSVIGWAAARLMIRQYPPEHNILRSLNKGSIACLANYAVVYLSYVLR